MPRSASRDQSDRYTGNRDYFHRLDWIARAKYRFAALGAVLAVGWGAYDGLLPGRAVTAHSPGPVADVHAAWDATCQTCHVPFAGTAGHPWSPLAAADRWQAQTCEKCHAGPAHHAAVPAADAAFHAQCSNCHHEHGGRSNSMTHIADNHCTGCHANPAGHGADRLEVVTRFAADHPEFRPGRSSGRKPVEARKLKPATPCT